MAWTAAHKVSVIRDLHKNDGINDPNSSARWVLVKKHICYDLRFVLLQRGPTL